MGIKVTSSTTMRVIGPMFEKAVELLQGITAEQRRTNELLTILVQAETYGHPSSELRDAGALAGYEQLPADATLPQGRKPYLRRSSEKLGLSGDGL